MNTDKPTDPEDIKSELQWCKKEIGYARTETGGMANNRLERVFERLRDCIEGFEQREGAIDVELDRLSQEAQNEVENGYPEFGYGISHAIDNIREVRDGSGHREAIYTDNESVEGLVDLWYRAAKDAREKGHMHDYQMYRHFADNLAITLEQHD